MSLHGKIRIEKDLESMNELSWKTDRDTGAASARQGREGGAALFASSPSSPLEVDLSLHQGAKETGQGGRVSSLNVLVDVGSNIQMPVSPPTFDV